MGSDIKNINNVINGVATIRLYDQIGSTQNEDGSVNYGISGNSIADQIQYLNEVEKVDAINLRINSIGGSVFEGYSIVSAMLSSKCPVNTYIDGLAASIAGVIAIAGKKCYMMDYGTLMLHNPYGKGVNDDVLMYIKSTLVKIISGRSKRNAEEIAFMMDGETWLNATDACKMGFVDEIVSSAKEFKIEESNRKNLYNLVTIYNKLITETTNTDTMENQKIVEIQNKLDEQTAELEALKKENENLKATNTELQTKVDAIEAEKTAKVEAEAVALVSDAIEKGKINAESKDNWVKMAKADFDTVKNSLEAISVKVKKAPTNILNAALAIDEKEVKKAAEREKWTIRDWEKKDAKGLENMYKNNREKYVELYNAYYKNKIQ